MFCYNNRSEPCSKILRENSPEVEGNKYRNPQPDIIHTQREGDIGAHFSI